MENRYIVLVDDHVIVRNGLKELIEKLGPYQVTLEYDNGAALLASVPFKVPVDLIVLDLNMPGIGGEEVMQELSARQITTPVLVLTLNTAPEPVVRLFRNGVRGYLPKSCSALELQQALDEIFRTGYYHNEFLVSSLRHTPVATPTDHRTPVLERLSSRERTFLKLVCDEKEYTYEQIADKMGVQHRTVDGYRETLFEKFGIRSKTGLVLFVLKHQLFEIL